MNICRNDKCDARYYKYNGECDRSFFRILTISFPAPSQYLGRAYSRAWTNPTNVENTNAKNDEAPIMTINVRIVSMKL